MKRPVTTLTLVLGGLKMFAKVLRHNKILRMLRLQGIQAQELVSW